ncbi:hypothetical protein [Paraburkholderia graminis]|uniref:hypothetical protein n=1 Tax=Paraburkholderia graminis TaxID=60548 RepID=UPI0038B856E5
MLNDIRVAVLATNAVGSLDLFLTPVEATGRSTNTGAITTSHCCAPAMTVTALR